MGKAPAAKVKDVPINVKSNDWIATEVKQKCVGQVDGKSVVLAVGGKLTINFDLIVPGKALGTAPQEAVNLQVATIIPTIKNSFRKPVEVYLKEGLEKITELHKSGDSKGYAAASSILDKLNKYIKDCLDDLRPKIRAAVGKKLGISAKELLTVGTCRFKELKIERGVFTDEVDFSNNGPDVSAALAKKMWQYCGVASSGDTAMVDIDDKKAFNESSLKELKAQLGKTPVKIASGRMKAESQTNLVFEFKEGDKAKLPTNLDKSLRLALNRQTGKKMSAVTATLKKEFTAEKGKGKEAPGEPAKGKG